MSSKEFQLSIITPEGKLFDAEAVEVNLPGSEGRFGVLAGHMNLVSTLKPGVVELRAKGDKEPKFLVVYDGLAEINNESCSVLVEKGAYPKDMKVEDINSLLEVAKKELATAETQVAQDSAKKDIEYLGALLGLKKS